jgi:hypothetical protein
MKGRAAYLVIAVLLTILNAAVAAYYGMQIWKAWSGVIWGRGLSVLLAALGATSLVKVWVQAIVGSGVSPGGRNEERVRGAAPIPVEARGHGDV